MNWPDFLLGIIVGFIIMAMVWVAVSDTKNPNQLVNYVAKLDGNLVVCTVTKYDDHSEYNCVSAAGGSGMR